MIFITLQSLREEIEDELNLIPEKLETETIADLKKYIVKLEWNIEKSEHLKVKYKTLEIFGVPSELEIDLHKLSLEEQIFTIKDVLATKEKALEVKEDVSKETDNKKKNKRFTLKQKLEIIKKMGVLDLMIENFDEKIQYRIFSELFDCNKDTARKIFAKSYKNTSDIRSMDYNDLLKIIESKITK